MGWRVLPTNDEDGVAEALETHVLGGKRKGGESLTPFRPWLTSGLYFFLAAFFLVAFFLVAVFFFAGIRYIPPSSRSGGRPAI